MNDAQRGILAGVDWSELCPWLLLFRSFRIAASPLLILVAAVGGLLTPVGWRAAGNILPADSALTKSAAEGESASVAAAGDVARWPWELYERYARPQAVDRSLVGFAAIMPGAVVRNWGRWYFDELSFRESMFLLCGNLWTLFVWGWCGALITRIAVVRLGRDERLGVRETLQFVGRRSVSYWLAPLFPQIAFLLAVGCGVAAGVVMRADIGAFLVALAWPLILVAALLCAIVFLGLALGWPFMWVAIGAEEDGDVFEATQRAYSYSWDRPFHYGFYIVVTLVYGVFCWFLATWFTHAVLHFGEWSVSWGAGWQRLHDLMQAETGAAAVARHLIEISRALVMCLAVGFAYSFFWVAYAAIYLLLRRDVDDHVPFDRVFVPDDGERYALPPIAVDEQGVVQMADHDESDGAAPQEEPTDAAGPKASSEDSNHEENTDS